MKDQRFAIKWTRYLDEVECSLSCSFSSYEAGSGCRLGLADGHRHPTDRCPGEGVYKLVRVGQEGGKLMITKQTSRGFVVVEHPTHANEPVADTRLIQESSAIGTYEDGLDMPGSSFLWIGSDHHLNREEVRELVRRMQVWLDVGRLEVD